jgi:hypothetical protein
VPHPDRKEYDLNDQIKADAKEYGRHVKQGGWRLGLLVARCVEKGRGTGGHPDRGDRYGQDGKVSASAFARLAGTDNTRVLRYLDAWTRAADTGVVPDADRLHPGVDPRLDWEALPEWGEFYSAVHTAGQRIQGQPTPAQLTRVIREADPATLTEALGDPEARMRTEAAASRSREIARTEARSERRAGGQAAPREGGAAALLGIGNLMSDGAAWAGRLSDAWENALRVCSDEQLDAIRGRVRTGSFPITKVLADIQGEGIDAALAEMLRGGEQT